MDGKSFVPGGWGNILVDAARHEPEPKAYQGKVILLIDRATWSAAEDFIMPFQLSQQGVLIGENSGGSSGQPLFQQFSSGMLFSVGTRRLYLPDGSEFEGVGIAPDIFVDNQPEDLYAGRDRVMESAMG